MKYAASTRASRAASSTKFPDTGAGQTGLAVQPPAYHIDAADHQVDAGTIQRKPGSDKKPANSTGLPDSLKSGVESLSGMSLDDVRVHYDSPRPAGLQALAYTQGSDIHLGPGQERHLPHEAWHVIQQQQGRVKPTLQTKGAAINDEQTLEREADTMGRKAAYGTERPLPGRLTPINTPGQHSGHVIQRMMWTYISGAWYADDGVTQGPPPGVPASNPATGQAWRNNDRYNDAPPAAAAVGPAQFTEAWANARGYTYERQLSPQVAARYDRTLGNAGGSHKPKGRILVHDNGEFAISVDQDEHAGAAWKAHIRAGNAWAYAGTYDGNLNKIRRGGVAGLGPQTLP